jgi:hypothetical protein
MRISALRHPRQGSYRRRSHGASRSAELATSPTQSHASFLGRAGQEPRPRGLQDAQPKRLPTLGSLARVASPGWSAAALAFLLAGGFATAPAAWALASWSAPTPIGPRVGPRLVKKGPERGSLDSSGQIGLGSLSCASPAFCVAVGGGLEPRGKGPAPKEYERGYVLTWDGRGWGRPLRVAGQLQLSSVSCPTSTFCVAIGNKSIGLDAFAGYSLTYNGRSWSKPALRVKGSIERGERAAELETISCASPSFCVVTNNAGQVLLYNGSSWSEPVSSYPKGRLRALACPAVALCHALVDVYRPQGEDKEGDELEEAFALTFNGSAWSAPTTLAAPGALPSGGSIGSLSCPSASYCLALGNVFEAESSYGFALTFDGSAWSPSTVIARPSELGALSCASVSFCVAVQDPEAVQVYSGGTWGAPVTIDRGARTSEEGPDTVSCPSESFCLALDGLGRAFYYPASAAPPAAAEKRATLRVVPRTVRAGRTVRISGSVGRFDGELDCPAGDQVDLFSKAFTPSKHEFAGVPTVYGKVARNGSFSADAKIPARRRPGRYMIDGRCGGGNLGVLAKLHVLPGGRGGGKR